MKQRLLILPVMLMCILGMSCDDALEEGALLLSAGNMDKAAMIQNATQQVVENLISEEKARLETYGDKKYVIPVAPFTYQQMLASMEIALQKKLGNKWEHHLNCFLNAQIDWEQINKGIKPEVPQEVLQTINTASYQINLTTDTGEVTHVYPTISGDTAVARAFNQPLLWVPVPFMGFYWVYGISTVQLDFEFENETTSIFTVKLFNEKGAYYPNMNGTVYYTNVSSVQIRSANYSASFKMPTKLISRWIITQYNTPVPDIWDQAF